MERMEIKESLKTDQLRMILTLAEGLKPSPLTSREERKDARGNRNIPRKYRKNRVGPGTLLVSPFNRNKESNKMKKREVYPTKFKMVR